MAPLNARDMWGKDANAFMIRYTQNTHITVPAVYSSSSSPSIRPPFVARTLFFLQFTVHPLSLYCTLLFLQFTVHLLSLCCTYPVLPPVYHPSALPLLHVPCSSSSSPSIRSTFVARSLFFLQFTIHPLSLCCTYPVLPPVYHPSALPLLHVPCSSSSSPSIRSTFVARSLFFLQFTVHPLSLYCTLLFLQFTVLPLYLYYTLRH